MIKEINYGLNIEEIKAIKKVLAEYPAITKVILYGSRAKGNFRNNSDIDITLVGKQLTLNTLFAIENDLDDLLLPYQIDLSLFHHIENPALIDHINRVGILWPLSNP